MAGPSIMVKILGDVTGLGNSFDTAATKGQSAASKMHSAFSGMLNTLNSSGVLGPFGNALQTADQSLQSMGEHAKGTANKMVGIGGAALGVGVALSAMGSKDQAAHQQLQASIAATGHSYGEYAGQVEEAIGHQEHFGNASAETQDALRKLTTATHDPKEAIKLLGETSDLAAAKHEDLSTAATQVGKIYNGNTKLLKEAGIVLDKHTHLTADHKTAVQALATIYAGQAAASVNTFSGHMNVLKTEITDHVALLGQKYGPELQKAGLAMAGLGSIIKVTDGMVQLFKDHEIIQTAATTASTVATWLWNVALEANPIILIVTLIALLVGAIVVVIAHFIGWKAVIKDTWDFIKVAFNDIKSIFKDVVDWVSQNWPLLLGILTGPVGLAVEQIVTHWSQVKQMFKDVIDWVTQHAHEMFDPFLAAAKAVWNGIAKGWNDTVGSLSFNVPGWVPFIGGKGFSMPQIPTFETGGYVPTTGLALLHAGETVIPANARAGPAVVIQNAHFSSQLDVDAFMRRAAWVARTQAL
jgi:hypothetical protein